MVRVTSALILIASAVGLAAAQSTYQDFELDANVEPTFASPVTGLSVQTGDLANGKAACDTVDNCLGVICSTTRGNCVPFAYSASGVLTPGGDGFDFISYRYSTPSGPSCDLFVNEFTTATGQCACTSLERQNTAFGCVSAISASTLPQVRRRSRIAPGHAQGSVFERRRVGGTFI